MEDAGADLPQVLDRQVGLRMTRLGGLGSFASLSIRGSTSDQVRTYVDGIPLDGADGGPVDFGAIPLGPLNAVALYRGYAPVLYGGSAIGGVVDIRTASLRRPRITATVEGGSFGTYGLDVFAGQGNARWGLAMGLGVRVSAGDFTYLNDAGTAFDSSDDRSVRRKNNASRQAHVMLKGRVDLGNAWQVRALNLLTMTDRGLPGSGLFETKASRLKTLRNVLGIRLESLGAPVQFAATGYLTASETLLNDPLGEVGLGPDQTDDVSLVPGLDMAARTKLVLSTAGQWSLSPILSVALRHEGFSPDKGTGPDADASDVGRTVVSGAGLVRVVSGALRTALMLEGRWEQAFTDASDTGGGSLRAEIVTRPVDGLTLSAAVSHALRLPTLFELYGDSGYVLGNGGLVPERATQVEASVGYEAQVLDGTLQVEASVFTGSVDNLIQYVQNAQQVSRPENVDAARLSGVEAGLYADLAQHLRLRSSLTWLDTENASDIAARRGRQLPLRPRWKAYQRVEIYHDFAGTVGEVAVWAALDHLSGNTLDHAALVEVSARWLVAAGVDVALDEAVRLSLVGRNLGDDRALDLAGFPLPGPTVMASLRWSPSHGALQ
jgi:vitamin B12 transporter